MRCGYDLWESFGHKQRDYFIFATDPELEAPKIKYASVEKVAIYIRKVFMGLQVPIKPRFQPWRAKMDDSGMFDQVGVMYWTGHSMRHFIPTVAAAIDIGKEQRDYVGRWHVNLHQSADYVHTSRQIVMQVQEAVNKAICEGGPSYDESELMEDYGCFLVTKGRRASDWVKHHAVWKVADGKYFIGGKWPTMEVDVIDNEIWEEHMPNAPVEEIDHSAQSVDEESKEDPKPVFFVTISRHSGFRRLHKIGCCRCRGKQYLGILIIH